MNELTTILICMVSAGTPIIYALLGDLIGQRTGITSLSVKPIRFITGLGLIFSVLSFIGVLWAVIASILGRTVVGWASTMCIVCFMGGIQLLCLGVIGEYIGKIYLETKARPRYIISERTWEKPED